MCRAIGARSRERVCPKTHRRRGEVKRRRDLCDYFRGEDSYDEERRKFFEENLKKYCTGTDKELASLKAKYKNNKTLKVLEKYEERIESDN